MSDKIIFQIQASFPTGKNTFKLEGRCCGGGVRTGDSFFEFVEFKRGDDLSNLGKGRDVMLIVKEVKSFRPGLLGLGETGTLLLEGESNGEFQQYGLLIGQ